MMTRHSCISGTSPLPWSIVALSSTIERSTTALLPACDTGRFIISVKAQSWAYCEDFIDIDDAIYAAHVRSEELGCGVISPGIGGVLRTLATSVGAQTVVEIGTGAGVASLWLLAGMPVDGVLTSIDINVEHQRAAREVLNEQNIPSSKVRMIAGNAINVLPRLTDGAYDLVFIDSDPLDFHEQTEMATPLLRTGGLLVINDALWHDRVADPARRDETTSAVRELGRTMRNDSRFSTSLLPIGGGLLVAARR